MPPDRPRIAGVVLAGGLSRRMGGGDKCLRTLAGRPLLRHVIDRLAPQVDVVAINANADTPPYADFDASVFADSVPGFAGPLAGVLSALDWAATQTPPYDWVVTVPCDAPFIPRDLAMRLFRAVTDDGADMACTRSRGRDHPVVGLWPVALREPLRRALEGEGVRKVDRWTARYNLARAAFDDGAVDPFFNVNTPDDLAEAERLLTLAEA